MHQPHVFTLPRIGEISRQALPHLIEGTIAPLALFYAGLHWFGLNAAITATLGFAYLAVAGRLLRGRPIPGMLLLSAILLTARSVLSLLTGSAFLYFLQPTLGGALLAIVFLGSALVKRPLAERLARDLVPLPDHVLGAAWVRTFFVRVTILWATTFAVNAGLSLWLLMTRSIGTFMIGRTAASWVLTVAAIAASTLAFLRTARANDLEVVWP